MGPHSFAKVAPESLRPTWGKAKKSEKSELRTLAPHQQEDKAEAAT